MRSARWTALCLWGVLGCGTVPEAPAAQQGPAQQVGAGTGGEREAGPSASAAAMDSSAGDAGPMGATPTVDAGVSMSGTAAAPHAQPLAERACGSSLGQPQVFPQDRHPKLVQRGFRFIEGPVWHAADGALYFSEMDFAAEANQGPPSRIFRLRPGASAQVFVATAGSNGLALDATDGLIACTHDVQRLSRFAWETGERSVLDLSYMGHAFNSPNDLTVRSDGTVYFTDPDWQLGARESETHMTGVYRVTPAGVVMLVTSHLMRPNGIALSPDERTLYVGSAGDDVLSYALDGDGGAGEEQRFASPGASDGMTVDCAGNLYVTADRFVHVYAPSGEPVTSIELDGEPSNVAFGGPSRTTLYITAGDALYALELGRPGLPY